MMICFSLNNKNCWQSMSFTWGRACITVSNRARIPFAILRSLSTLAILSTLMTRMIVGLMGNTCPWISSRAMPMIERNTMDTSNWFHLEGIKLKYLSKMINLCITYLTNISVGRELTLSFQLQLWISQWKSSWKFSKQIPAPRNIKKGLNIFYKTRHWGRQNSQVLCTHGRTNGHPQILK